jgi:hypothetical protein
MKWGKSRPFIQMGVDGKYRIYKVSPFGVGLVEQVKGTKAYNTRENALKKVRKVM